MKLDRQASATNPIATVSRLVRIQVLMKHEVLSKSEDLVSICYSSQPKPFRAEYRPGTIRNLASAQTNFVIAPRDTAPSVSKTTHTIIKHLTWLCTCRQT